MKEIVMKTSGMKCSGCENRLKNALSTIDGVKIVDADHKTGIVKIHCEEKVENKIIKDKIEDIGFKTVKED